MGSSATILLGVAAACQSLAKRPFNRDELLPIAAKIEGHPDNVAAACLGGFTIVGTVAGALRCQRFDAPQGLVAVVAIPPFEVTTSDARRILPQDLSRAEHVQAVQRTALITAALASGASERLRDLFDDAWHERHRVGLNPGLVEARAAARDAGAIGTILSGSGSTVLSFCQPATADAVRAAVLASYQKRSVNSDVRIVHFDNAGITQS
jgi:homoserine kinase